MRYYLIGLSLVLLPAAASWSAEPTPPPTQYLLRPQQSGGWQLLLQLSECTIETKVRTITKKVPLLQTVTETVNGEVIQKQVTRYQDLPETQTYSVCVPVYKTVATNVAPASLKAFETDGRAIPAAKLRSRVGEQALVVVSPNEAKVSETYASLFRPGTLCVVLGSQPSPGSMIPQASVSPPVPAAAATSSAATAGYPNSPSPQLLMISRNGTDEITLRRMWASTTPVTVMKTVNTGKVTKQAPLQMMHSTENREAFTLPSRHVHFGLGDTRDVAFNRVQERLSRETPAVYAADTDAVDPFWLQNLKSSALVVTGPQLPMINRSAPPAMAQPQIAPPAMAPPAIEQMPPVEVVPSPVPRIPTPQVPVSPTPAP